MNLRELIRSALSDFLGIGVMQKEINELRVENQRLESLFNEHDKALAYMAIVHGKAFKEILTYFQLLTKDKRLARVVHKKADDDLIN